MSRASDKAYDALVKFDRLVAIGAKKHEHCDWARPEHCRACAEGAELWRAFVRAVKEARR